MTKINLFINIFLLLILLIFSVIPQCSSVLSDKRLCYDLECSEPISQARTLMPYHANEKGMLSFPSNVVVEVYSKEAGSRSDLWGIKVNNRRGYAPKNMLREIRIYKSNLVHEVPTENFNDAVKKKTQIKKDNFEIKSENNSKENLSERKNSKQKINLNKDQSLKSGIAENTESKHVLHSLISEVEHRKKDQLDHDKYQYNILENTMKSNTVNTSELPENVSSNIATTAADNNNNNNINVAIKQNIVQQENTLDINVEKEASDTSATVNNSTESDVTSKVPSPNQADTMVHVPVRASTNPNFSNESNMTYTMSDSDNVDSSTIDSETFNVKFDKHNSGEPSFEVKDRSSVLLNNQLVHNEALLSEDKHVLPNREETISQLPEVNDVHKLHVLNGLKHKTSEDSTTENTFNKATDSSDGESSTAQKSQLNQGQFIDDNETFNNFEVETSGSNTVRDIEGNDTYEKISENDDHSLQKSDDDRKNEGETFYERKQDYTSKNISSEKQNSHDREVSDANAKVPLSNQIDEVIHELSASGSENNNDIIQNYIDLDGSISNLNMSESTFKENDQEGMQDNNDNLTKEETANTANDIVVSDNYTQNVIVNNNVYNNDVEINVTDVFKESNNSLSYNNETTDILNQSQSTDSSQKETISQQIKSLNEFSSNRNLLNVHVDDNLVLNSAESSKENTQEYVDVKTDILSEYEKLNQKVLNENIVESVVRNEDDTSHLQEKQDICTADYDCINNDEEQNQDFQVEQEDLENEDDIAEDMDKIKYDYWSYLLYMCITSITTLVFSLGYYYIENMRRDGQLIEKINKLEKELLIVTKECMMLDENLKSTTSKLNSIQDESFGSNEMVLSLKTDLEASQIAKAELEDQICMLEKDLESATEAGLELERMLREVLSSNNEVNPLAQSVEDLQARLITQQAANESLTNTLNLKVQENETLTAELVATKKKCEELDVELTQIVEDLKRQIKLKNNLDQTSTEKVQQLESQINQITIDKADLYKELRNKEAEIKDLVEVINQVNSNSLDIEKLYDVSRIKAEAADLLEERDDLKIRLNEIEGARNLLEEHMKLVKEEVSALSDQCKLAEKEKRDAETRLEVLSNFFKEKETQRQKEEAIWLQKQGEVMSTVEKIQTMQNEIQNYKQQTEILKREILDQEREYKSQISTLETKAHQQWVITRQNERRLEESKAESAQLRNRLTLIEKNINDTDVDPKLHRLEANGETATSPPLFIGAESSSSPIMFTGSSGVSLPPPPSFMLPSFFPPCRLPPLPSTSGGPSYDVGQRSPPLGGRLFSPPPMPPPPPILNRYENTGSPPPLINPHLGPFFDHPPFPPPPPDTILPPSSGTTHLRREETLPPPRNYGFHSHQREQRAHNQKGSLHSSGESLDKTHHNGKV